MEFDVGWIEAGGSLIGAAATVGAVVYGVGEFTRRERGAAVSKLRETVTEVSSLMSSVDAQLNDANFLSLGLAAAKRIRGLFGEGTVEDFKQHLLNLDDKLLHACIMMSEQESSFSHEVERDLERVRSIVNTYRLFFPSISLAMRSAVHLASKNAFAISTTQMMRSALSENRRSYMQILLNTDLAQVKSIQEAEMAFGLALAQMSMLTLRAKQQKDFDAAETIVNVLADWIERASQKELLNMAKNARVYERLVVRINYPTYPEDIRAACRTIRRNLGKERLATIDQCCVVLESGEEALLQGMNDVFRSLNYTPEQVNEMLAQIDASGAVVAPAFREMLEGLRDRPQQAQA
jgi:hypothetical protein